MSFFKPKKETIDFETQEDLPSYHFDANGFLLFDDASLGGCGIFKVIPMVMTSSITHKETLGKKNVDTQAQDYRPRIHEVYGDRRRDAVVQWVSFVNGLMANDEADDMTHVQVILKKTRPDEWRTAPEYAITRLHGHTGEVMPQLGRHARAYRQSYEQLLRDIDGYMVRTDTGLWNWYAYDMLAYIVVSYTPSSEGWWLDGRDDDYYVKDTSSQSQLFDVDGFAEKVANRIVNRDEKKVEKEQTNTADILFPIREDMTAQIIETRMNKIERNMAEFVQKYGTNRLTFDIQRTHMVDNTVLVAFWNNILTPYRYRVWNMGTNMGDVLTNMHREEAIATGDASYLDSAGTTDEGKFLAKYAGRTASDIEHAEFDIDHVDSTSDGSVDEALDEAWGNIDPRFAEELDSTMTAESPEEQFIRRYQHRTIGADKRTAIEESVQHADDVLSTRSMMKDNAAYSQTNISSRVSRQIHDERMASSLEREHKEQGLDMLTHPDDGLSPFSRDVKNPFAEAKAENERADRVEQARQKAIETNRREEEHTVTKGKHRIVVNRK